jgi:hypothetical protein
MRPTFFGVARGRGRIGLMANCSISTPMQSIRGIMSGPGRAAAFSTVLHIKNFRAYGRIAYGQIGAGVYSPSTF